MKHVAFIVLFLALVGSAFAQHPKKAVKAYEAAEEAFLKRDYKKAQQQVLKAVTEDPNYAEAWLLEGEIGMESENDDLAILGYEKALLCDSMLFPPAAINLARLYDKQATVPSLSVTPLAVRLRRQTHASMAAPTSVSSTRRTSSSRALTTTHRYG